MEENSTTISYPTMWINSTIMAIAEKIIQHSQRYKALAETAELVNFRFVTLHNFQVILRRRSICVEFVACY
jgi:hypothetical protein